MNHGAPVSGAARDDTLSEYGAVATTKAAATTPPLANRKSHQQQTATAQDNVAAPRQARSWDAMGRQLVAGGLAGCAGKTVVAPLDRVKILFQASNPQFAKYTGSWFGVATAMKDIYRQDGGVGLYRGHSATLLRIFPYAGIKFLAYEQIRNVIIPSQKYETPWRRLVSGSLAGVTSVFFTYPLEVIRVRLAFETKREGRSSLSSICRQIYNEQPVHPAATARLPNAPAPLAAAAEGTASAVQQVVPRTGIINFYRGFLPTVLGMLPYAGMSFLTHDTVSDMMRHPSVAQHTTMPKTKQQRRSDKPAPLSWWAELAAGGISGIVSQTASYPLEVIRRRMQVGGAVGDGRRLRLGETAAMIFRERGIRGFFVGLTIGYVKVLPMSAVAFYTYERMKLVFGI